MLKLRSFVALSGLFIMMSCSDDDNSTGGNLPGVSYMSDSIDATRDYQRTVNNPPTPPDSYRLTTSNRDTTVEGRTYRVFENNSGPHQYFSTSGSDYYSFVDVGGVLQGVMLENLYLKSNANVGNSWTKAFSDITIPGIAGTVSGTLTNKIEEKGITHLVFANSYSDVIRVSSSISNVVATVEIAPGVPFPVSVPADQFVSNIQSYYAPKVGLIENRSIISIDIDLMGFQYQDSSNVTTKLTATNIP